MRPEVIAMLDKLQVWTQAELEELFVGMVERGLVDVVVTCAGKSYPSVADIPDDDFDIESTLIWFSPSGMRASTVHGE